MSLLPGTLLAVALLGAVPLGAALAQGEPPQVARHELMEDNGDSAKILGAMAKGEAPYDAAVAARRLGEIADDIEVFVTLFPEGSETGHDTRALPTIWSDRATFEERAETAVQAANAAAEAAPGGHDAFRAAFGRLGEACGGCHETFRAEEKK